MRGASAWCVLFAVMLALGGCSEPAAKVIAGEAMGTRYQITLRGDHPPTDELECEVSELLESIEAQASQWRSASWVSQFNRSASTQPTPVPEHVWAMLVVAEQVHRDSGGALDITAAPLVELWGFGAAPQRAPPSEIQVAVTLARCGGDKLLLDHQAQTARKTVPALSIDLSALGKGYTVDRIAELLDDAGVTDYVIAFGGEVRAKGDGPGGDGWVVAAQVPGVTGKMLTLRDEAVATSGGSQQYRVEGDGTVRTHLIDPRSGKPVADPDRSVTVIAKRAVLADAWATAMVVAPGKSVGRAAELAGVDRAKLD